MNYCHSCTTCKNADKSLERYIIGLPMKTSHHRVEGQSARCGFGLQGICCRLCSNDPCRIAPEAPHKIHGASADVIVTRNFLRIVAAGSGCYIHVVKTTALNLKKIALSGGALKGVNALEYLCQLFRIPQGDPHTRTTTVAQAVLDNLYLPDYTPMKPQQKLPYVPRLAKWNELEILSGDVKSEVYTGVAKCSTSLNSDPIGMLLHRLKLGIPAGVYGLMLTDLLNDVMLGEPEITPAPVDPGVIDPGYINITITGHQYSIFVHLQKQLKKLEVQELAKAAGARGLRLVGCTCVGQDLWFWGVHCQDILNGHTGDNYIGEAVLATGAIDAVLSEFNCTPPGTEPIYDRLNIQQTCLDDVTRKQNAALEPFVSEDREYISREILNEILKFYRNRRARVSLSLLPEHGNTNTIAGVSEVSLKKFLGGSWKPPIDLTVSGDIKGITGVVGCSNLMADGHDILTVELIKEFIARDILILIAGCSSGDLENYGLMTPETANLVGPKFRTVCESLGTPPALNFGSCLAIGRLEMVTTELALALSVDIPQLPLVLSAAQWLEEQTSADGAFGLALDLPLHLGLPPFIAGNNLVAKILTEDMKALTDGQIITNSHVGESADTLEQIIMDKRQALNIQEGGYETGMN